MLAGKVVARSGGGELIFIGRSLDSMFDLLSGALADVIRHKLRFTGVTSRSKTSPNAFRCA